MQQQLTTAVSCFTQDLWRVRLSASQCPGALSTAFLPVTRQMLTDYRQHCAQHKPVVFNLLCGRFWGFLPRRGNTLHEWGEIWHGGGDQMSPPPSQPNFTPIDATTRV